MKWSRFTEQQIIGTLKEAEAGTLLLACVAGWGYVRGPSTGGSRSTAGWKSVGRGGCSSWRRRTEG